MTTRMLTRHLGGIDCRLLSIAIGLSLAGHQHRRRRRQSSWDEPNDQAQKPHSRIYHLPITPRSSRKSS